MDVRDAGLQFVVAPLATRSGTAAARLDDRHSVSVLAHVDGDEPVGPSDRAGEQ